MFDCFRETNRLREKFMCHLWTVSPWLDCSFGVNASSTLHKSMLNLSIIRANNFFPHIWIWLEPELMFVVLILINILLCFWVYRWILILFLNRLIHILNHAVISNLYCFFFSSIDCWYDKERILIVLAIVILFSFSQILNRFLLAIYICLLMINHCVVLWLICTRPTWIVW